MKLLPNSTIPTLCGHRIDIKNADHIGVREKDPSSPEIELLFANYKTYTEDLKLAENNPQEYTQETIAERRNIVNNQKHRLLTEVTDSFIKYKPKNKDKITQTIIQILSTQDNSEPICSVVITHEVPRNHKLYLAKIGIRDECKRYAEKLEAQKSQQIKREGLQPAINILTCILALIAAIGAIPIIINSIIKATQFIGNLICNITQNLN